MLPAEGCVLQAFPLAYFMLQLQIRNLESRTINLQWLMETELAEITYAQNIPHIYKNSVLCMVSHPHIDCFCLKDNFIEQQMNECSKSSFFMADFPKPFVLHSSFIKHGLLRMIFQKIIGPLQYLFSPYCFTTFQASQLFRSPRFN